MQIQAVLRRFVKKLYIPLPEAKARDDLIRTIMKNEGVKGNKY